MLKLVKIPVWTIILGLIGVIGSLTAYAYSKDVNQIKENKTEINDIKSTYSTKKYVDSKIDNHEKSHLYLQSEISSIKESNKRVEDKLDKILFKMADL